MKLAYSKKQNKLPEFWKKVLVQIEYEFRMLNTRGPGT